MDISDTLDTAISVAREAGALLTDGFGRAKEIERKSSAVDYVTQYDRASETLIVSRLRDAFPDHGLVGEEGTEQAGQGLVWYIDPLDGTSNYAHGFPVYCVSMALYDGDRPLLGVIYNPNLAECFTAVTGRGAHIITPTGTQLLRVSGETELESSLLATGFPYDVHTSPLDNAAFVARFIKRAFGLRRAGSAALDMAYVAAGRLDGYWEFKLSAWDVAAGILMVQEAGGIVTAIDGKPLRFGRKMDLLASNGNIHDQMATIINEVAAGEPYLNATPV